MDVLWLIAQTDTDTTIDFVTNFGPLASVFALYVIPMASKKFKKTEDSIRRLHTRMDKIGETVQETARKSEVSHARMEAQLNGLEARLRDHDNRIRDLERGRP